MLVLSTLHKLLSQAISRDVHAAALWTPTGQLVACAHAHGRSKDDVRVLVGVASEVWAQTIQAKQEFGVAETVIGRVVVAPVEDAPLGPNATEAEKPEPLMLVSLVATDAVEWEVLERKARDIAKHLAKPIGKIRAPLQAAPVKPVAPVPVRGRLAS